MLDAPGETAAIGAGVDEGPDRTVVFPPALGPFPRLERAFRQGVWVPGGNRNPVLAARLKLGTPAIHEGIEFPVETGRIRAQIALADLREERRLKSGSLLTIDAGAGVKDELASALASMLREMEGVAEEEETEEIAAPEPSTPAFAYEELIPLDDLEALTDRLRDRLKDHGLHTAQDVLARSPEELAEIPGIGPVTAQRLRETVQQTVEAALAEGSDESEGEE